MPSDFPAISVIIPMYNAEKYIGELLDSLLIQTFQDFEVIVVDDCSTDNSAAVVESYIPKFNGRLILNKLKRIRAEKANREMSGSHSRMENIYFSWTVTILS